MSRAGTILRVDLSGRRIEKEPTSTYTKKWFGGDGIGSAIICSEVPPETKAYDPGNILTFNMGPLCGTARGSRGGVMTRSPLVVHDCLLADGLGGQFSAEMKFAGYDNLVIKGKADKPVYLFVNDDKVEIRDASHLWGITDTYQTQERIKGELNDPDVQVACIGPAGENQVRYAVIYHDIKTVAGRCGPGGVMGAKNLKAIAVRGTKGLKLADPERFIELWNQFFEETFPEPLSPDHWSRTSMVDVADIEAVTDTLLWGSDFSNLVAPSVPREKSMKEFVRKYFAGNMGCAFCPEQCYVRINVPGVGAGAAMCAMPGEFHTRFKTYDPELWWQSVMLTNRMGLDCSSTCNIISWLMELHEKGIITAADTDGVPMEWGSREAILTMIVKIGRKQGVGEVLADGVLTAARRIGRGTERYARHIKGVECNYYYQWTGGATGKALSMGASTNSDMAAVESSAELIEALLQAHPPVPGMTKEDVTEFVTAMRDAKSEHMCGDPDAWKMYEDDGKTIRTKNKALATLAFEDQTKLADMVGVCDQSTGAGPRAIGALGPFWQQMADFTVAATGEAYTPDTLKELVKRVRLQERGYEGLCGMRRDDESQPEDYFGVRRTRKWGTRVFAEREHQEKIKNEFYGLRGCDIKTGIPRRDVLESLGLEELADKLDQLDVKAGDEPAVESTPEVPHTYKARAGKQGASGHQSSP